MRLESFVYTGSKSTFPCVDHSVIRYVSPLCVAILWVFFQGRQRPHVVLRCWDWTLTEPKIAEVVRSVITLPGYMVIL